MDGNGVAVFGVVWQARHGKVRSGKEWLGRQGKVRHVVARKGMAG